MKNTIGSQIKSLEDQNFLMKSNTEFIIQKSFERHHSQMAWLDTHYSFSFAYYHDEGRMNWGSLRVFNDDVIKAGKGFGMHPHRDMEIITYVLSGTLEHEDSMGNKGQVSKGGVQYMSAGTGVVHSERNPSPEEELHLVQMWVLPKANRLKPNYGQEEFAEKQRLNKLLLIASGEEGKKGPITIQQDASFYVLKLDGNKVRHEFKKNRLGFLFIASGKISGNGNELEAGDSARIKNLDSLELDGKGEIVLWDLG